MSAIGSLSADRLIRDRYTGDIVVPLEQPRLRCIADEQMVGGKPPNLGPRSSPLARTCRTMIVISTKGVAGAGKWFARIEDRNLRGKASCYSTIALKQRSLMPPIGGKYLRNDGVPAGIRTSAGQQQKGEE